MNEALSSLVERVRTQAIAQRGGRRHGFFCDATSLARNGKPTALVGIATVNKSYVLAIDMADYNGNGNFLEESFPMVLMELLGCEEPSAIERATAELVATATPTKRRK